MFSSVLVATDGEAGALGALNVARLLEARDGARVEVLSVHEPSEIYAIGGLEIVEKLPARLRSTAADTLLEAVRAQLSRVGTEALRWPLKVETGRVAPTIARAAAERDAGLVLVGLREPAAMERWLSREMLLRTLHLLHVPLLAVPPDASELPRQAVLGVDFSDFSGRAARELIRSSASDVRVHLVHVSWSPFAGDGWRDAEEWQRTYLAGVEQRLGNLAADLPFQEGSSVVTRVLTGDPADELLRYATEVGADLIAVGSHGSGFLGRVLIGSVSSRLVHRADCALLIVPPEEIPPELG